MNQPVSCQVDFYVLQDASQSAELLACRLAMMAWEKGKRVLVVTADDTAAQRLNEVMWQHPVGRFLPHDLLSAGESAPVSIGTMEQLSPAAGEVVINLTDISIPQSDGFQRLLELVPAKNGQRAASREKFRDYRNRGLKPVSHSINSNRD